VITRYRPRRPPLLERLGLRADLGGVLAARLVDGAAEDGVPVVDIQDAVLRQDMAWLLDLPHNDVEPLVGVVRPRGLEGPPGL
jgi:hypothetical protein